MIESTRPFPGVLRSAPSVIAVGKDFYMARSSFEWYPGVELFSSRDLRRWGAVPRLSGAPGFLDLRGVPAGCGVLSVCLGHSGGRFHLIYTVARDEAGRSVTTYAASAEDMRGPWGEPKALFEGGFALSLFYDAEGAARLLIATPGAGADAPFNLLTVRYLPEDACVEGDPAWLDAGDGLDLVRGARLVMHGADYFLTGADGDGRGRVLRAARPLGPYQADPSGPLPVSGACQLIEGPEGRWLLGHAGGARLGRKAPCDIRFLEVDWREDGWPGIRGGDPSAIPDSAAPDDAADFFRRYEFFGALDAGICSLRVPPDRAVCSLWARPGFVRLYGRESILSRDTQSFLATEVRASSFRATAELEYEPRAYLQAAGLCLRRAEDFFYLQVTWHDRIGRCARLMIREGRKSRLSPSIKLDDGPVQLRIDLKGGEARFFVRTLFDDGWTAVAPGLSPVPDHILSGERNGIDGAVAYLGFCCQDQTGNALPADFRFLDIRRE